MMLQAVYKIPLCVLLLASVALRPGGCNGRELTLAVFVSGRVSGVSEAQDGYTGDLDGRPFRAAVNMAVEMVNNDSAILPGYTLARLIKDSRVSSRLFSVSQLKHTCHVRALRRSAVGVSRYSIGSGGCGGFR